MLHAHGLESLLIFLACAGIIVPLFHRARVNIVLGFLLVGVVLGPHGLGRLVDEYPWIDYITFDQLERGAPLGELGIIFLLFLLGLELSLDRLWQLRRYVLGVGLLQVVVSAFLIGGVLRLTGLPAPAGIVLGLCLALSSTAIVMQLLTEERRSASRLGRIALSILLFQDLMVVPVLVIVGSLAAGSAGALPTLVIVSLHAFAAVVGIMVAGRYLVGPLLRSAARTGSRELIVAITLLIVLGISGATGAVGLSVALGAFLAGLLLSESEYRHQIEVDFEPFKGLLLGIFFVSVGTTVDLRLVLDHAGVILLALAGLLTAKAAVIFLAARLFGVPTGTAAEAALLLAQAGEFAFVVIALAGSNKLLSPELAGGAVAVVSLSMMATPVLAELGRRLGARLERGDHAAHAPGPEVDELSDHVIIGGFGRVGQTIARLLDSEDVAYVALDMNATLVGEQRQDGRMAFFGDASRREMLLRAGAERARAVVVTLDDPDATARMVDAAKALRPDVCVLARARDPEHAAHLTRLGAVEVIPDAVEASLQLGARLLEQVGMPESVVLQRVARLRDHLNAPQPAEAP